MFPYQLHAVCDNPIPRLPAELPAGYPQSPAFICIFWCKPHKLEALCWCKPFCRIMLLFCNPFFIAISNLLLLPAQIVNQNVFYNRVEKIFPTHRAPYASLTTYFLWGLRIKRPCMISHTRHNFYHRIIAFLPEISYPSN